MHLVLKKSDKKKEIKRNKSKSYNTDPSEFYLQTLHDCIENWIEFAIAFQITGKYIRPH